MISSCQALRKWMQYLQERYGNMILVSIHYLKNVLSFCSFKIVDVKALDIFAILLINCQCASGSHVRLEILKFVLNVQR